jgi:hypothetical protein
MKLLKTYRLQHGQAYTPNPNDKAFQGIDPQTFRQMQAALSEPNRYCDAEFYGDKDVQLVVVVQRPDSRGIGNDIESIRQLIQRQRALSLAIKDQLVSRPSSQTIQGKQHRPVRTGSTFHYISRT